MPLETRERTDRVYNAAPARPVFWIVLGALVLLFVLFWTGYKKSAEQGYSQQTPPTGSEIQSGTGSQGSVGLYRGRVPQQNQNSGSGLNQPAPTVLPVPTEKPTNP